MCGVEINHEIGKNDFKNIPSFMMDGETINYIED